MNAVLVVIGYRMLEVWARRREAPVLDTSALGDGQWDGASRKAGDSAKDGRLYDELAARLRFQLSAMEVRTPGILPGGSRSNGLASIAEASGVAGSDLAGAIIRFFGMLWPNPRRFQVRVRVECVPDEVQPGTKNTKVTVSLDEPARGRSIATKTMVAGDLDEAAAAAAGYVAQHIFTRDPTTPPWCLALPTAATSLPGCSPSRNADTSPRMISAVLAANRSASSKGQQATASALASSDTS